MCSLGETVCIWRALNGESALIRTRQRGRNNRGPCVRACVRARACVRTRACVCVCVCVCVCEKEPIFFIHCTYFIWNLASEIKIYILLTQMKVFIFYNWCQLAL